MPNAEGGLTRRTITGLLWASGGKAGQAILQLVILAIMARLLTPADFGVVSAALVVIGFSYIFSMLGLGPALIQRPVLEARHLDTAFTSSVIFGLLLGALIWVGAPVAADILRIDGVRPVLRVLAWMFPLQGVGVAADSLLRRELHFRWLARLDVAAYAFGYGLVGRRLWVDRVASAWLIRRHIDPQARFVWLKSPADCPKRALGFDFDGATFTHAGARVTFETLLASFGLETPALLRLGVLVHGLDAGGVLPPEAAGVERVLAGMRDAIADDDQLVLAAAGVFEGLLVAFEKEAQG